MARHSGLKPFRSAEEHKLLPGALSQAGAPNRSGDLFSETSPRLQVKQLQGELRSVLDAVHSGALLIAVDGQIRFANAHFGMLFGLDPSVLASLKRIEDVAHLLDPLLCVPGAFVAPWKVFAACAANGPIHDELELKGPARRVFERHARPVLDDEGRRLGWLEIYSEVTNQRHIQSKLVQTEKMAALGQLVSGIAHELNNPLTSIMGYAQLALGRVPETLSNEVQMIFSEAERARRIVKNLLYFARQAQPERTRVDLNEIVERTVALRGYELKIENIAIRCELAADLPATLADPHQLQQVVLNLLVNAEQAILESRGRGSIQLRTRKTDESRLLIEVSDDGPGILPEIASRVFDPFFTTKPPGLGTGLGLSIVYGIVEQHGGDVAFENLSAGGAKFTVEIPLLPVPAEIVSASAASPADSGSVVSSRVLVVEDEPTVAQLISDVLCEEGHKVEAVLDSQEGLTRLARSRYDLIICDLRMPRLDGPAFYDALVRTQSPARDRILFITGDTLGPHTVEFLKSRQLPFLAKPFLVEELKLAANRILAGHARATSIGAAATQAKL